MGISKQAFLRVQEDLCKMSEEKLTFELINSSIYAFGSELAVLRISKRYPKAMLEGKAKVDYSKNLEKWFFRIEI